MDNDSMERKTGAILVLAGGAPEKLAAELRRRGDLAAVAVTSAGTERAGLREALADVRAAGAGRILVAVLAMGIGVQRLTGLLEREIALHRVYHPEVEVTLVTAEDGEEQGDWLGECVDSYLRAEEALEGVPLSALSPHRAGTIHRLRGGREFVSRLAALGFIPGCPIEVIQNFGVGPLIVAIRDTRIALGRREADKVRVRLGEGGGRPHRGRHRSHRRRHWRGG